jgi:hypothetical protein
MRCSQFAAALAAVLLMLASAGTPLAGVVVAETSTAQAANGETFSVARTIYVQGNKQKVERQGLSAVTDLDKNVMYVIDNSDRVYTEMPLTAIIPVQPGEKHTETIQLNKTGKTRVIADQPCEEYRSVEGGKLQRVTISLCVSPGAPGAKEVSQFERKMVARLSGNKSERSTEDGRASLLLEKESILSFRVPDGSRRQTYRTASLLVETRVNRIQLKPLPPETFKPPKGYRKLQNQLQMAPSDPLEAPDQTVDAVGLKRPFYS